MSTEVARPPSQRQEVGTRCAFDSLNEPGTYVCEWSGHLLRIPDDGVKPGRSPTIEIRGKDPIWVTKIAEDPYVTLTKARMIASDLDLAVNF